jgi:hypothetical protein
MFLGLLDPDPGSISQRFGSGFICQIVRKTLMHIAFVISFLLLSYVNVPSKSNSRKTMKKKFCWHLDGQ